MGQRDYDLRDSDAHQPQTLENGLKILGFDPHVHVREDTKPDLPALVSSKEGWAAEAGIGTVSCSDVAEPERRLKAGRENCLKLCLRLRNEHSKFPSEAMARPTADRHGSGFEAAAAQPSGLISTSSNLIFRCR